MPWKEQTVIELRRELVMLVRQEGGNLSQLCECYEVSHKTGYRLQVALPCPRRRQGGFE